MVTVKNGLNIESICFYLWLLASAIGAEARLFKQELSQMFGKERI
jgi:hypothetical protein